jgi:protease-4
MRKIVSGILMTMATLFVVFFLVSVGGAIGAYMKDHQKSVMEPSVLVLDLEGVIIDGEEILEHLREYRDDDKIKGVLVRVNSPGGVVGASQEIASELLRLKTEFKKPVVVAAQNVIASGAYYAATSADKIIVNPGAIVGSIGVIMEFANLERLYDWAKINPYVLKTGNYKDSGSPHRPMRDDERKLFQSMIDEVLAQFKKAVAEGRKLAPEVVDQYADGRIFSGQEAVRLGFADQVGTYEDAVKIIGELSGLGKEPELFTPPKLNNNTSLLAELAESTMSSPVQKFVDTMFHPQLMGKPLYILPSALR